MIWHKEKKVSFSCNECGTSYTTKDACQSCARLDRIGMNLPRRATKNEIYDVAGIITMELVDEAYLAGYAAAKAFVTGKTVINDMCYTSEATINSWNMGVRDALGDLGFENEEEEGYDFRMDGELEEALTYEKEEWAYKHGKFGK